MINAVINKSPLRFIIDGILRYLAIYTHVEKKSLNEDEYKIRTFKREAFHVVKAVFAVKIPFCTFIAEIMAKTCTRYL